MSDYCSSCWDDFLVYLPAIFTHIVFVWAYYVYMVEVVINLVDKLVKQILYGTIYNILFLMMYWCYITVLCTQQDIIPATFMPSYPVREQIRLAKTDREVNALLSQFIIERRLILKTRNDRGLIRYCHFCKHVKPDRTHHCSMCDMCILKMDHHCPWVATCVGYTNYKYFILFLIYLTLYLFYSCATLVEYFLSFFNSKRELQDFLLLQIPIACLLSFTIGMIIVVFLVIHFMMIYKNETTLENMTEPTFANNMPLTFNVDPGYNCLQVFGCEICLWFFPFGETPGSGVFFDTEQKRDIQM